MPPKTNTVRSPLCNSDCSEEGHFYSGDGWAEWLPSEYFSTCTKCGLKTIPHIGAERPCWDYRHDFPRPCAKLFGNAALAKVGKLPKDFKFITLNQEAAQ